MAIQHGRSGLIHIAGVAVGHATSWSYSETAEEIDVTAMGDNAKTYMAGLREGTVNLECHWDFSDAGQEDVRDAFGGGSPVAFTIYPTGDSGSGSVKIEGEVTVTNREVSSGVDQVVSAKVTGRGFLTEGEVA